VTIDTSEAPRESDGRHISTGRLAMGLLDKAKAWVGGNKSHSHGAVDKGADIADDKSGGKYTDKIDMGADKAKDQIDKLPDT
jgi:hypothetical protein